MNCKEILAHLKSLGDEKRFKHNKKYGAGDNQFGVKMGDIRKIAKKIKLNHDLALELWSSNNIDARMVAILIMEPEKLSAKAMNEMVRSVKFSHVADWLNSYVVKLHPDKEALRQKWMKSKDPMSQRAGWNLTKQRIIREPEGINIPGILDRIEAEMGSAHPLAQWTMNFALAETGIKYPEYRERAIDIGERLGIYADYPTAKGCTSPYAPIWINAMVDRQK